MVQDDEVGQRKKTDEPMPDIDVDEQEDEQEESSVAEQDVEPSNSDAEPVPNVQQANQSSPKKRTKADLDVSSDAAVLMSNPV